MGSDVDGSSNLKDDIFSSDVVEYTHLSESLYKTSIDSAFSILESSQLTQSLSEGCIACVRILNNILLNPWDQSKRWINLNSKIYQNKILPHPSLIEIFNSLGFNYTDDHLYLNLVSTPRLLSAYERLIEYLRNKYGHEIKSNSNHFFDPYKAYKHTTTSTDVDCEFELTAKDEIAKKIHETKKKLNNNKRITSLTREDLCIKLIQKDQNISKPNIDESESPCDGPDTNALLRIKNMNRHFQFQSLSKMKLDNLLKCKVYEQSRVQFVISPLETLELTLPSSIKIEQIDILLKKLGCTYTGKLCLMPLKTELSQKSTLLDLDLVPSCKIHITGSFKNNKINKEVLNNFKIINFTE